MGLCLAFGVGPLIPELSAEVSKVAKPKSGLSTLLTSLHPLVASLAIEFCLSVVPELLLTVNFHLLPALNDISELVRIVRFSVLEYSGRPFNFS